MGNNINLIRSRAERPPTVAERISVSMIVAMVCAYAFTAAMAVFVIRGFDFRAELVQREIEKLHERPAVLHRIPQDELENVERELRVLEAVVRHFEERWEWGEKLALIRRHVPPDVVLTSFAGQTDERIFLSGYADNSQGRGMENVRMLVTGIESEPLLSGRIESFRWPRARLLGEHAQFGAIVEFEILCRTTGQ